MTHHPCRSNYNDLMFSSISFKSERDDAIIFHCMSRVQLHTLCDCRDLQHVKKRRGVFLGLNIRPKIWANFDIQSTFLWFVTQMSVVIIECCKSAVSPRLPGTSSTAGTQYRFICKMYASKYVEKAIFYVPQPYCSLSGKEKSGFMYKIARKTSEIYCQCRDCCDGLT